MKYSFKTIAIILSLFLITQLVGLAVNNYYFNTDLPFGLTSPEVETEQSPIFFIGMILAVTALFLFMQKFKLDMIMKVWFFSAFVVGISITLSAFLEASFAIIAAIVLTLLKFKERDLVTHNLGEILLYGGIVSLFIPILDIWAVTAILILISIYDFVAVFMTKHMVSLAKKQEELGIFSGLLVINKNEVAILGGGDIAFTMLFAGVLLRDFGGVPALLAIYGAALGIFVLIMIGEKKKFYPAMPFVTIGSLLGFALSMLI